MNSTLRNTSGQDDKRMTQDEGKRPIRLKSSIRHKPYSRPTQTSSCVELLVESHGNNCSGKVSRARISTHDTREFVTSLDESPITSSPEQCLFKEQDESKNELRIPSIDSGVEIPSFILSPPLTNKQSYRDGCISVESDMEATETSKPQHTVKKMNAYLQSKYIEIKSNLYPDELADILFSKELLGTSDREQINEMKHLSEKCDKLIKSIAKRSRNIGKEHGFVLDVLNAFKQAKYGYLVDDFSNFEEPIQHSNLPIDDFLVGKLSNFLNVNGDEIDMLDIIDELLASEVLKFEEHQSILDAICKEDKLKVLKESILKKNKGQFGDFCSILKNKYPSESELLFDCNYTKMDTTEDRNIPIFEIQVLKEVANREDDSGETGLKFVIEGANGEAREVEEMIVEQNSPRPSTQLSESVTEEIRCGIKEVTLSSIKITFEHMSEQSRMLLLQKCKDSPKFLERLVRDLFDQYKAANLKQHKGIKEVQFKIQVNWPEFVLSRQDIARNYSFLVSQLEHEHYGELLQDITRKHDVIKKINSKKEMKSRHKEFIVYLVTDEHAPIEKFSAKLKGTTIIEHIKTNAKGYRSCGCQLTKKKIVQNYTMLGREMKHVDRMIDIFVEFYKSDGKNDKEKANGITTKNDDIYKQLNGIKDIESQSLKVEAFLRMVLASEDDDIKVCLFGETLVDTDQEQMLRQMLIKSDEPAELSLSKDDVRRNKSFLLQELEPLLFIEFLSGEDVQLREQIVDTNSRKERCDMFLEFLKESNAAVLDKFSSELQYRKLKSIINHILSSRHQGHLVTKDDIVQNKGFIEDMLEERFWQRMLSDTEDDESREDLYGVLSTSRNKGACEILDILLCSKGNACKEFITYIEKERPEIVTFLVRSRGEDTKMVSVKDSLLEAYSLVVSEIEPKKLKHMFIEKGVISTNEYDLICSKSTRRKRAIELMTHIIAGSLSRVQCLIEALEFYGYGSLVKQIMKNEEKFKRCPRIYRLSQGVKQCVAFEGAVKIKFDNDEIDNLLNSLDHGNDTDEFVSQWLVKNQEGQKHSEHESVIPFEALLYFNDGNEFSTSDLDSLDDLDVANNSLIELPGTFQMNQCSNTSKKRRHWEKSANNKSASSSLLGFDKLRDERSASSTILSTDEDSNSSCTLVSSEKNLERVRNDLTSISNDFEKQQDTANVELKTKVHSTDGEFDTDNIKNNIKKQSTAKDNTHAQVKQVCSCTICGENVTHTDSKMGECKLHSLYFIK